MQIVIQHRKCEIDYKNAIFRWKLPPSSGEKGMELRGKRMDEVKRDGEEDGEEEGRKRKRSLIERTD